jgi:hypothetical protein
VELPAWDESPLRFLHPGSSLSYAKLTQLRQLSTETLKASLLPGEQGSLKVRPDGTVLDGHHRVSVLTERGVDVDRLPRQILTKGP